MYDGTRWMAGPYPVGWLETTQGRLRINLFPTRAGRIARALLEEQLLDVELSREYPPTVRLTG